MFVAASSCPITNRWEHPYSLLLHRACRHIKSDSVTTHHCDEAPNKAEVCEVVRVDGGGRVYLQTVVVLAGVFKQTVHGIQDLVGQQEEPLPANNRAEDVTAGEGAL